MMKHRSRTGRTAVSALVVACLLRPVSAAPPTPPSFPSAVELITVDVVVVDAKGKPVTDLTKGDFVVEEDGKPQEVVTFEAVSAPPPEAAAPVPSVPEPPAVVTNAITARKRGRVFALLADDLRLPAEQSRRLRQAMADFIDRSLGPGDTVVLGTTSGEAWWSARLPEGREDLHGVLGRLKGRYVDPKIANDLSEYEAFWIATHESERATEDPNAIMANAGILERVVLRLWDKGLCGSQNPPNVRPCWPLAKSTATAIHTAQRQLVANALRSMERALHALSAWPGRTSLVFFSPGFIQDNDVTGDIAGAALRAHTAVYFVDVRGLETGIDSAAAESDVRARENPGNALQKQVESLSLSASGAEALAEETGGFSVRNTNDLSTAGEKIASDSRTFYLLGIRPTEGKRADAWRKLRVKVNRPGVTIRARRGYSLRGAAGATASGAAAMPIPLRLASYVLEPVAGRRARVLAVAEVDLAGLPPGELQMRLEAMPRDGGQSQIQDVSLQSAPAATGAAAASTWRTARLDLQLGAGIHNLRVFVRDPATGRVGVVEQRIVAPAPDAFRLSTPVLSDTVAATRAADGGAAPLPVAHDEFAPRAERPLLAAIEVFGAAKEAATGQTRVESEFVLKNREGRPLAAPPASPLAPASDGRMQQIIALPPLPGGDYDLSVTVRDRVAGAEQVVHRTFKIAGAPAAAAAAPPAVGADAKTPAKPVSPELAAILERAGRYVLEYGRQFSSVLAEEECRQELRNDVATGRTVRKTRSGTFFVTLPGPLPWATFRDVWEVDGAQVRDHEERLARLFKDSPANAVERAMAIVVESARYNLGPRRTMNIPTLPLLFLHPDNQSRFDFEIKGRQSLQATAVVEVAFHERVRPALIGGGNGAKGVPARGRFWIDPERGTILKSDVNYEIDPLDSDHNSQARVVTEYRREAGLGMLVPDHMQETYEWAAEVAARMKNFKAPDSDAGTMTLIADTRYASYSRFQVTTEERYDAASAAPRP
jgi:VWFA-related protein